MTIKQFDITMTDGNVQHVEADYYSYDTAQYIFWKHDANWGGSRSLSSADDVRKRHFVEFSGDINNEQT